MEIGVRVGDIMTRNFVSVSPKTQLLECARKMIKNRVGSLVITEAGILKGIITERDIIWVISKKPGINLKKISAGEVSPRKIATIKPNADLLAAIQKMSKSKYRWLPVIVKNKIIGLLTLKDILRIQPDLFEIARAHNDLEIREEAEKLKRLKNPERIETGICEECGNEDTLYNIDSRLICESCKDTLEV